MKTISHAINVFIQESPCMKTHQTGNRIRNRRVPNTVQSSTELISVQIIFMEFSETMCIRFLAL